MRSFPKCYLIDGTFPFPLKWITQKTNNNPMNMSNSNVNSKRNVYKLWPVAWSCFCCMNSLQHDRLSAENSLHNTIHYTRGSCNCDLMKTNTTLFLVGPECLVLCLVGPGYTWPCVSPVRAACSVRPRVHRRRMDAQYVIPW